MKLLEIILGLSLAFISQTGSRFDLSIGVGELGLFFGITFGLLKNFNRKIFVVGAPSQRYSIFFLIFVLVSLLPITILNTLAEVPGASLRDWVAYLFVALFLVMLAKSRLDLELIIKVFLFIFLVLIASQLMFSGYETSRYNGGSHNPNQLALYVLCGIALCSSVALHGRIKFIISCALLGFGILSGSDAFGAASAVFCFSFFAIYAFPLKRLIPWGLIFLVFALLLLIFWLPFVTEELVKEWNAADEGGSRIGLYEHGLAAWLSSPVSFLIGNGAGSFSGLDNEFGRVESHNTPIDALALGGCLGLIVFYWFPIKTVISSYKCNLRFNFSILLSLLAFSLFHYVGRQPVFWFTMYVLIFDIEKKFKQL